MKIARAILHSLFILALRINVRLHQNFPFSLVTGKRSCMIIYFFFQNFSSILPRCVFLCNISFYETEMHKFACFTSMKI